MHKPHVLLIEDDTEMAALYIRRMKRAEYNCHTVETVADALAYLETQEVPDVIVTDIDLPDGKGIDVITHCREHVKFDDATIIVVSAHAFIRENRVSRFQPDCVLIKPVSPQHLNIIINEELKRRRDPASA